MKAIIGKYYKTIEEAEKNKPKKWFIVEYSGGFLVISPSVARAVFKEKSYQQLELTGL